MEMTFTYYDDGEEVEASLPAKNEVCSFCEGTGFHLTRSIGEHAYSMEEFYEAFDEPEDREEYFRRGGRYDVECETCHGKNVVLCVDEKACRSDEEKALLKKYYQKLEDIADDNAEREAERRMGY
jgi:predicted methyltransferase